MNSEIIAAFIGIVGAGSLGLVGFTWRSLKGRMAELSKSVKTAEEKQDSGARRLHTRIDEMVEGIHTLHVSVVETQAHFITRDECDRRCFHAREPASGDHTSA